MARPDPRAEPAAGGAASVILLVSVEDLSYAEAASVLGIPVGTVMSSWPAGASGCAR